MEHQRKKLVDSYVEGFTMHGLTKIFMGNLIEKIFWSVVLVLCMGYVGYFSHQLYTEYKERNVYMNFKWRFVNKFYLPSITVCPWENHENDKGGDLTESFEHRWDVTDVTGVYCVDGMQYFNESCTNTAKIKGSQTLCDGTLGTDCNSSTVPPNSIYPRCLTFNMDGKAAIKLTGSAQPRVHIEQIDYFAGTKLNVFIHDVNDLLKSQMPLSRKDAIILDPGVYKVVIDDEKVIKRRPYPYPSNCSDGKNGESIFPGPYSLKKCADTCLIRSMMEVCGNVPDVWRSIAAESGLHPTKKADEAVRKCILMENVHARLKNQVNNSHCECQLPCEERLFSHEITSYSTPGFPHTFWGLEFEHKSFKIEEIEEIPTYEGSKFWSDIGGWLGLLMGMSVMSVIEVIVYLTMKLVWRLKRCL